MKNYLLNIKLLLLSKKKSLFAKCLLFVLLMILNGCSVSWPETMKYGKVQSSDFYEIIDVEIESGLIFIVVIINDEEYKFLLDTGAPTSISEELQEIYHYRTLCSTGITDTDNNKTKMDFVQVDTLFIGSIPFYEQTAFVGNFNANPLLKCLEIDGIIGSNLMRLCNWSINQDDQTIALCSSIDKERLSASAIIPFTTDKQYNILLDIGLGESVIHNMKVDYGSNGVIEIPQKVFSVLKQQHNNIRIFHETGIKQTGIIGKPVAINNDMFVSDSVTFSTLNLENVQFNTSSSGLIGNKVLVKFIVTIDWDNKNLYLQRSSSVSDPNKTYGIKIGHDLDNEIFIQSVIDGSPAYNMGIRPFMKVLKFDSVDFSKNDDICDFLKLMDNPPDTLSLEVIDSTGMVQLINIERFSLRDY